MLSGLITVAASSGAAEPAAPSSTREQPLGLVLEEMRHAETYYWFGLEEEGNQHAFELGLAHLERAEALLAQVQPEPHRRADLRRQIEASREDLEKQKEVAADKLLGVFPLLHVITPTIFSGERVTATYELIEPPDVTAVRMAVQRLAAVTLQEWPLVPQFHVVVVSSPRNPFLEKQAAQIINQSPKFFLSTSRSVAEILPDTDERPFRDSFDEDEIRLLRKGLNASTLGIIALRLVDQVGCDTFYVARASVYLDNEPAPRHQVEVLGFCRDARALRWPLVAVNVLFLLLAIVSFGLLVGWWRSDAVDLGEVLVVPALGFLVARTMPWLLVHALSSIAPEPYSPAAISFWWPAVLIGSLIIGPCIVLPVVLARLVKAVPSRWQRWLRWRDRTGALFGAMAFGVCAYLAGPLLIHGGHHAWVQLLPTTIAIFAAMYVIGEALDLEDRGSRSLGLIILALVPFLGPALCNLNNWGLWLLATASFSIALVVVRSSRKVIETEEETPRAEGVPEDVDSLIREAARPAFQPFESYEAAVALESPFLEGKTVLVGIVGRGGVGKTRLAEEMAARAQSVLGPRVLVLRGGADGSGSRRAAFDAFRGALAPILGQHALEDHESSVAGLHAVIDTMLEESTFAHLLLGGLEDGVAPERSTRETCYAAISRIRAATRKRPIVLLIDDAQWLDEESRELLQILVREFPGGGPDPLLLAVASREREALGDWPAGAVIEMTGTTTEQCRRILSSSLGLARQVGDRIIEQVGRGDRERGELFWLLQVVAELGRRGAFVKTDEGFDWSEEYRRMAVLPVPSQFRDLFLGQLKQLDLDKRRILDCAACVGRDFSATVVAHGLSRSPIDVLHHLQEIEEGTGIVVDLREGDDHFQFASTMMLEVLREKTVPRASRSERKGIAQVYAEIHGRLAEYYGERARSGTGDGNAVYRAAMHSHYAGRRQPVRALEDCIAAARRASTECEHRGAREFLGMAREHARTDGDPRLEELEVQIECRAAHIEGRNHLDAARRGLDFIEKNPEASVPTLVAVARACYEAGRMNNDQLSKTAAVLSERICSGATTDLERAEGLHLLGLALSDPTDSEAKLREGLALAAGTKDRNVRSKELYSMIANSLAELLIRRGLAAPATSKAEARSLFETSLAIKEELGDRAGQARTHGGLGRLAMIQVPRDLEGAKFHFGKDLELSTEIGDVGGQALMYSKLAECELAEGRTGASSRASRLYGRSFEVAETLTGKCFALAGLLACGAGEDEAGTLAERGRLVLDSIQSIGEVPHLCKDALRESLTSWKSSTGPIAELRELLWPQNPS